MYEKLAWDNFIKTGSVESFLEYRKILEINNNLNTVKNIKEIKNQNVGDFVNEIDKGERHCY